MNNKKAFFERSKIVLNKISPVYFISGYLLLVSLLTYIKITPYDLNLSSLIGLWQGFANLNSHLIDNNFIVFYDGGYDGQFFYLISKQLFMNGLENLPILDSFFIRFNRLGLSLLAGTFSYVIGFQYYAIITLLVLHFIHLMAFILIRKILSNENKYLSLYFLFSPFALNSNLLLVSDSLLASFIVFSIYALDKYTIIQVSQSTKKELSWSSLFLLLFILIFLCLIKESGIVILFSLLFVSLIENGTRNIFPILFSIILYLLIINLLKISINPNPGTNPLSFLQLIDFPLFGFFKSIQFHPSMDIKSLFREMAKFPVFIFFILLTLNLLNIKTPRKLFLSIPILFVLFTSGIGEVGYWLSFDNISRMFTISIPWIILLKEDDSAHNDYYALAFSIILLLLLIIRIVYIKTPMRYYFFQ
ncbi:MAG TPA: hypothetical protein PK079_03540 [Leptospiraceae bacterium]|nr:hypothetical protein [Leptospiraceae bacterium]HMX33068.1 hypothetical protein [Leptospiraceae bacterium]HMY29808.1 hypothetical protein [Leptospiraceae bacterium]HMZ67423.1 hypothetical protein [Leptospiraceae bacterium]HNA06958.1 hypothetical protein [Leptospiraceae bacterium]